MLPLLRFSPVAALALLAACTDAAKAPAAAAVQAGEAAIAAVRAEASRYVPERLKALEDTLGRAKDQLAKEEFKAALETAKDLPQKAKDVGAAALARKNELLKAWAEVSGSLPGMLEAIRSRTETLSAAKKLPAGLDAARLRSAKDGLARVSAGLEEATARFKAGALQEAIGTARPLKDEAVELMRQLGMESAPAATR